MKGYLKDNILYEGYEWNKIGRSVEAMKAFLSSAPKIDAIGFPDKEGVVEYEKKRGKQIHFTDEQQWQQMSCDEKDSYFEWIAYPVNREKEKHSLEFRDIISHALLGSDIQRVSKETWDLVFDKCAEYAMSIKTPTGNPEKEASTQPVEGGKHSVKKVYSEEQRVFGLTCDSSSESKYHNINSPTSALPDKQESENRVIIKNIIGMKNVNDAAKNWVDSLIWPEDEKTQSTLIISQVKELVKNSFIKGADWENFKSGEEEYEFARGESQRELTPTPKFSQSLTPSTKETGQREAIAFGKYLARQGWKPYDENSWENSDDDTASTETIYNDFKQSPGIQPSDIKPV